MTRIIKLTRELAALSTWSAISSGGFYVVFRVLQYFLVGECHA